MYSIRLITIASAIAALTALSFTPANAQTRRATARATPTIQAPLQVATEPKEKCLRALNGACTNPVVVEEAQLRAVVIPAVRVSYFGTPAGTVGSAYIPFERLFQDNPTIFGLPTNVLIQACCVTRSK
jgi:hypothetical protein